MVEKEKGKFRTSWGTMKKIGFIFLCIVVIGIFNSIFGGGKTKSTQGNTAIINKVENSVLFDANTLYGKDISGIRDLLGTPTDSEIDPTEEQMNISNEMEENMEWSNTFSFSGYDITVTYYVNSQTVLDIFISNGKDLNAKQCDEIMKKFGIEDGKLFNVEKVKMLKDSSKYTGIKLIPIKQ